MVAIRKVGLGIVHRKEVVVVVDADVVGVVAGVGEQMRVASVLAKEKVQSMVNHYVQRLYQSLQALSVLIVRKIICFRSVKRPHLGPARLLSITAC